MALSLLLALAIGAATLYFAAFRFSYRRIHPREPPVLAPRLPLPFIGHLIGMLGAGGRYTKSLGLRNPGLPIFALPILGQRIYIVTSPSLAAAVQRASRALSFTPLVPEVTKPVLGLDDATQGIVRKHLDPGPGDEQGYLAEIQGMVYSKLGPGHFLDSFTRHAAQELRNEVADHASRLRRGNGHLSTDLLLWVRHFVTMATAKYLYGPRNPLALDPSLEGAFWDFDHGLIALLVGFLPSITARTALKGRERLVGALGDYLERGDYLSASPIISERVDLALKHGWTLRMAARSELSFLFAGIVNTTTSTFWILLRLYADPELLAAVRREVAATVKPSTGEDTASRKKSMNLSGLREHCPTLTAVYSECLRLGSDNFSTRKVKEDILLAETYMLKKDSIVQIAGGVIHADKSIWGPDADKFNPARFLDREACKQRHPASFRAFGGGKTLCPGRHFAMNEILSLVAIVLLQFDIVSPGADCITKVPAKYDAGLPVHILEPTEPVKVAVSLRAEGRIDAFDIDFPE